MNIFRFRSKKELAVSYLERKVRQSIRHPRQGHQIMLTATKKVAKDLRVPLTEDTNQHYNRMSRFVATHQRDYCNKYATTLMSLLEG